MKQYVLFVLLLWAQLASAQCREVKDPLTGEVSRGGLVWITPQVDAIALSLTGDSLQLTYINPNIRDYGFGVKRGQRVIFKTTAGLDTLYASQDYANSPTTGLVANYPMGQDLTRYRNISLFRIEFGDRSIDVALKPRQHEQWNKLLGCILTKK